MSERVSQELLVLSTAACTIDNNITNVNNAKLPRSVEREWLERRPRVHHVLAPDRRHAAHERRHVVGADAAAVGLPAPRSSVAVAVHVRVLLRRGPAGALVLRELADHDRVRHAVVARRVVEGRRRAVARHGVRVVLVEVQHAVHLAAGRLQALVLVVVKVAELVGLRHLAPRADGHDRQRIDGVDDGRLQVDEAQNVLHGDRGREAHPTGAGVAQASGVEACERACVT